MAHMMVLNPRKRKRRRMTAKQRMYFGKGRRKRKAKTIVVETNPRRRRRKHRKHHRRTHARRRSRSFFGNPVRRRRRRFARNPRRRFRRNPLGGSMSGFLMGTIAPAAIGAAGAIGIDALIGNVTLPPQLSQGVGLPIVRIGAALLLGAAIGAVSDRQTGEAVAAGAVTVTIYQLARSYMAQSMPNVRLAKYVRMGKYVRMRGLARRRRMAGLAAVRRARVANMMQRRRLMGMRLRTLKSRSGGMGGMGYMNPARTLGRYIGR